MALVRPLAALLLLTTLTGCIVVPARGYHRHGYVQGTVVVTPAPHGYREGYRDGYREGDRDDRYDDRYPGPRRRH